MAQSGFAPDDDSELQDESFARRIPGLAILSVAGVSFRSEALQRPEFMPGQRVQLIPEPENEHDPYAVGVWDASGEIQVGYVPRREARRIRHALKRDKVKLAVVLSQFRGMTTGARSGLSILTSPTDRVSFGDLEHGRLTADDFEENIPF